MGRPAKGLLQPHRARQPHRASAAPEGVYKRSVSSPNVHVYVYLYVHVYVYVYV